VILRGLASLAIVALLALDVLLPRLDPLRAGRDPVARAEVPGAVPRVGEPMPGFTLRDLDGAAVRLSDLRGHRVLLTFERSVDW